MIIPAKSPQAKEANRLVSGLQAYFVSKLNFIALKFGEGKSCEAVSWGRVSWGRVISLRVRRSDSRFNYRSTGSAAGR